MGSKNLLLSCGPLHIHLGLELNKWIARRQHFIAINLQLLSGGVH